jgi:hypothetical protein
MLQTWAPDGQRGLPPAMLATGVGALSLGTIPNVTANRALGWPKGLSPSDTLANRNKIQAEFVKQSRLNIPVSFFTEALHSSTAGGKCAHASAIRLNSPLRHTTLTTPPSPHDAEQAPSFPSL